MYVCVCVLFPGWRTRKPDLSHASPHISIYNFVFGGRGELCVTALSSEGAFYEQSSGFFFIAKHTKNIEETEHLLFTLQKKKKRRKNRRLVNDGCRCLAGEVSSVECVATGKL